MTTDEQARVPAGSSAGGQFAKGGGPKQSAEYTSLTRGGG